jgi:hypothetical protein
VGPQFNIGPFTFYITNMMFARACQYDILAKYQFCNGSKTVSSIAGFFHQMLKKFSSC